MPYNPTEGTGAMWLGGERKEFKPVPLLARTLVRILQVKVKPGTREHFACPRSRVSIKSGVSGRMKLVRIEDL